MNPLLTDLSALLVSNPTNILYLTGFIGAGPAEREAYALVTSKTTYLFTNALYIEQAQKLIGSMPALELVEISRDTPLTKALQNILKDHVGGRIKLGFEDIDLTVAEHQKLTQELTNCQLIATRNRVEALRTYKRTDELSKLKKACQLTDDCFEYLQKIIKPRLTETEIALEIELFFKKHGAQCAFSPIVACNENGSQPHYVPAKSYTLKAHSVILIDFGARIENYNADMTRMLFVGPPTAEQKHVYTSLKKAQQTALDHLKSGTRSGARLDNTVREVLTKNKLPQYTHSLGHGIGLDVHEDPRLTNKFDMRLEPGMVFSIEPGVYFPGKLGMRIEDLVYITEDNKIEVLSKSSKEITII